MSAHVKPILFDPVDVVDGRWRVCRTRWRFAGLSGWMWAAAGQDENGNVYTLLTGAGLDAAAMARRFADRAARCGVRQAREGFRWTW